MCKVPTPLSPEEAAANAQYTLGQRDNERLDTLNSIYLSSLYRGAHESSGEPADHHPFWDEIDQGQLKGHYLQFLLNLPTK